MRTLEEARNYFAYHPATPGAEGTGVAHSAVRDLFGEMLDRLWVLVPDGPDKTVMVRSLWETSALANLAIALTAPADTSATRSVARVLPETQSYGAWRPVGTLDPVTVQLWDVGSGQPEQWTCEDPNCSCASPSVDTHDYSDPRRVHAAVRNECDCT